MTETIPIYESGSGAPPTYEPGIPLPATFRISTNYAPPLVSVASVKAHLILLEAFCVLKRQVISATSSTGPERDDVKWSLFLIRAASRFEVWVNAVVKKRARLLGEIVLLQEWEIPPLDVVMCWHAYLLSPLAYFHDCEALHPQLRQIGPLPLESIAWRINPESFEYTPTIVQIEEWELATCQSFEPPLATGLDSTIDVTCPRCGNVKPVPLITPVKEIVPKSETQDVAILQGVGYAQRGFAMECQTCGLIVTRDVLCANNVAQDIGRASDDFANGRPTFLTGNLLGARNKVAADIANHFPKLVLRGIETPDLTAAVDKRLAYAEHFGWSLSKAQLIIEHGLAKNGGPRAWQGDFLRRSMRSYRQPLPFSIDLVGAVLRQFNFSEQVRALGWTHPGYLDSHPEVIMDSIIRYHAFLDLTTSSFRSFVPTLSIDLSWHTHMLSGERYRQDTLKYVDRFVDHNDKVEEGHLASAYADTVRAWKVRFKTMYFQPLGENNNHPPKSKSASSTLSLKSTSSKIRFWKKKSDSAPLSEEPTDLCPPPSNNDDSATINPATGGSPSPSPSPSRPTDGISNHNAMLVLAGPPMITDSRKLRETAAIKNSKKAQSNSRPKANSVSSELARSESRNTVLSSTSHGGTITISGSSDGGNGITDPFLRPLPEDGVGAASFASLGKEGWDLWGPRDGGILDGSQKRGDCCTGVQISCSTMNRLTMGTQDWAMHMGSPGQLE